MFLSESVRLYPYEDRSRFYHIYEDISIQYITLSRLFIFALLRSYKKHKNANKRISQYFPLRCFLGAFLIFFRLFVFCTFAWLRFCAFLCFWCFLVLFGAFWCFWCFLCVQNLFVKKNKEFKTDLITSFILLLNSSYYKHEFF